VLEAERLGAPFFLYRDPGGAQRIVSFPPDRSELTVGRSQQADISLAWDAEVSALHAVLERLAGELALVDDGLSRNGSYVNSERVRGRQRVRDQDMLRFGQTAVLVRSPTRVNQRRTVTAQRPGITVTLSEQQRKVLVALCRPLKQGGPDAAPATNQDIADELFLSVGAVKVHLRALFGKFELDGLAQNHKRMALAARALQSGLVADRDLARGR
jgi:FHA domain/Bacterial regulatory proteins, luxR family